MGNAFKSNFLKIMDRTATIAFKSMLVRGDGDTDFFFAGKDPGDLFYTISVEKINASGQSEKVLEIIRSKANQIQKFAGSTISQQELTSGMPFKQAVPDFKDFDLEAGSTFRLTAEIRDDDRPFADGTAHSNRVFNETFIGDFPNETLRMQGSGMDIDLLYSVRVTKIPGLIQISDPVKDAGITQDQPEAELKGVEMFTSPKFQLSPFSKSSFSEIFQVGEYPTLPQQIPSTGKPGQLQLIGVLDNSISSIKVGKGFNVTLFMEPDFRQITPPAITLTGNVANLGPTWDNKISSFIVGEIPLVPPPK